MPRPCGTRALEAEDVQGAGDRMLSGERLERKVQRRWRVEFGTQLPTRLTITKIQEKFEVDGTVQDVLEGQCGRKRSFTDNESVDAVMQAFAQSPKKCDDVIIVILMQNFTSATGVAQAVARLPADAVLCSGMGSVSGWADCLVGVFLTFSSNVNRISVLITLSPPLRQTGHHLYLRGAKSTVRRVDYSLRLVESSFMTMVVDSRPGIRGTEVPEVLPLPHSNMATHIALGVTAENS
ncbi:hypothetical protein ANN_17829 [Periplaneta americana]|uniref:Uncharacterized protein n=1 Tax=Periplaneta americana TaxID=6978 RepID=A0ABQ8SU25_PERAM|nr:hypothetical protein ANN_17829 [Periplaneta americana]